MHILANFLMFLGRDILVFLMAMQVRVQSY